MLRHLPILLIVLAAAGCPKSDAQSKPDPAKLQPSAAIPAADPLLRYEDLRLGMSNLEIAQAYNAPDGKGNGFTRGVEDFGDVRNHIIEFDQAKGVPARKMVLQAYQDKLDKLVDRRDGLTAKEASAWLAKLTKKYGKPRDETLAGAQWVWGEKGTITLTYTQDNSGDTNMSANVVLVHEPSYDASVEYLRLRESKGGS